MLELGQRVRFSSHKIRVQGTVQVKSWKSDTLTPHKGRVWTDANLSKPMEGVIVGFRHVRDGYTEYIGYEEGSAFVQTNAVPVYLVATNIHQTPWKVNPNAVEVVEGSLL